MPRIENIRPVLLSAPYSRLETNLEPLLHLPGGYRTTGMVEVTLENGIVGLGEGYLAVFAPALFQNLIDFLSPLVKGRELWELNSIMDDLVTATGYWSLQGAARHAISAIEIALQDCRARTMNIPVWRMLGGAPHALELYASGGDSISPEYMSEELNHVESLGIRTFKIRARQDQVDKAGWCLREADKRKIGVAVDMTQNLAYPSQSIPEVVTFCQKTESLSGTSIDFLEEALGPSEINNLHQLRQKIDTPVAGGEIITTPQEMITRIAGGCYDIAQPDATVIGGIQPTLEVFYASRTWGCRVFVHCWGGPVGMMANFHAALAGGGHIVEWPLPRYPLREMMVSKPWRIENGYLQLPEEPGLGVILTPEIEKKFPFREDAVYSCKVDPSIAPKADWKSP